MSGHSRWAQVKHKKAISDAKKSQRFSKLVSLVTHAARSGGANPDENPRLRQAVDQARAEGMSGQTIERAIQRAVLPVETQDLKEVRYEAYGPGGAAILIDTLSDNPNRTHHEIRQILNRFESKIAAPGSVQWLFQKKLVLDIPLRPNKTEADELMLIDAGAEDVTCEKDRFIVSIDPERIEDFKERVNAAGLSVSASSLEYVPRQNLEISPEIKSRLTELLEALDEQNEIQEIYTNVKL